MAAGRHAGLMTVDRAETIAAMALAFVAEDAARLVAFLSATGLAPQTLRSEASSHRTLAAVLDHLAGDESLLLVFASNASLPPQEIARARAALDPGADHDLVR